MAAKDRPSFQLGYTCVTPGAAGCLPPALIMELFSRHEARDWGEIQPEDALENDRNADQGGRVRSVYLVSPERIRQAGGMPEPAAEADAGPVDSVEVWIITEPDRFDSILMLPSEYIAWESGEKRVYRERLHAALLATPGNEALLAAESAGQSRAEGQALPGEDFFAWLEEFYTEQFWTLYREQRFERRFAKGPLVPGLDRMTDEGLAKNIDEFRRQLGKTIRDGTFRFRFLRRIEMEEGGKRRVVSLPVMRDRLLDNILARYLSSRLGMRPQPHVIVTSRLVQKHITGGKKTWFVRTDIASYFDSIDHGKLGSWLEKQGIVPEVSRLVRDLAGTPRITPEEMTLFRTEHSRNAWEQAIRDNMTPVRGLPQGLYTSNVLAEAWLADWINRHPLPKSAVLVRYVDDFLFLCDRQSHFSALRRYMKKMEKELGVRFSADKTVSGRISDGFDFLGFFHRPGYARRSDRSIRRFKMRWIEALENPMRFLETRMDPWYLHGLTDSTDDAMLRESVIFGLVVYYYNLSIIGWGRTWEPANLLEYDNLQQLLPQIAGGQIELEEAEADSLRERFAELGRDLFGIAISGSALYNSFCTDFRQIDEINRWAGRLFAGYAARKGLAKPRLEDHLKWYFFFRKQRTGYTRKVLREYIRLYGEKKALIEKLAKNTPL